LRIRDDFRNVAAGCDCRNGMRAAQSQQRLSQRCGRLRLSQRHAGGAVTATAADGAASANVTPTAGQKSKKSARDSQNVDFWHFWDFLARASHLGTAVPGDSPES